MKVKYSYLGRQFGNCDDLWKKLKAFVKTGDFTLGKELLKFEKNFAKLIGTRYAVGVNSGTDAIKLSLKVLNIKSGDEITIIEDSYTDNTFFLLMMYQLLSEPPYVICNILDYHFQSTSRESDFVNRIEYFVFRLLNQNSDFFDISGDLHLSQYNSFLKFRFN